MIAAQKVGSENEETWDQIWVRATVTTKPVERTAELKHQITQIMAARTQTGGSNGHTSILSIPQEWGHECWCSGGGSSSHPDACNSRGGPGQMIQPCSLLTEHAGKDAGRRSSKQGNQGPSVREEGAVGSWDPLSPVLQVSRVGPHCQGVPYPGIHFKPAWGESRECDPPPSWQQPPKGKKSPSYSHPDPRPRLVNMKASSQKDKEEVSPDVPFLNPDLIACLMGHCNKAPIIVDGQKVITLITSGAQVSSVSSGFCEQMALKVHPLDRPLKLEGTSQAAIPYLGYVEVNLQIPGIRGYNKDVMLLVILTMTYAEKVPVMVGSNIIDRAMGIILKGELSKMTMTWRQAHFSAIILGVTPASPQMNKGEWEPQEGDTSSNNLWPLFA